MLESAVLAEATCVDAAVLMNLQIALSCCVRISLKGRVQACLYKMHAQSVHSASAVYGSVRISSKFRLRIMNGKLDFMRG